jgi:hypothetical protein
VGWLDLLAQLSELIAATPENPSQEPPT